MLSHSILNDYNKKSEIRQAIKLINEYIGILTKVKELQNNITDRLPYVSMIIDLEIAIEHLEYQLAKAEAKPINKLLQTAVLSSSEIQELPTNYLPGSICYVAQDNIYYILNPYHEWVKF